MTLRAEPGQNPVLSVATDAELSAINTSFLVNGDYLWSDESGGYIYLSTSVAPLSSTVLPTANSNGGALPGRFISNGIGPVGPTGSAKSEFIYRPGDPSPAPGVYTSWTALVADAALYPGDKEVFFNDDLQAISIPSGTYDFGPGTTTFKGSTRESVSDTYGTRVTLQDGVRLIGVRTLDDIFLSTLNTTVAQPVIDLPDNSETGVQFFTMFGKSAMATEAAGPLLGSTTANTTVQLVMYGSSALLNDGGLGPVVRFYNAGQELNLELYDAAIVDDDTIAMPDGPVVRIENGAVSVSLTQPSSGVLSIQLLDAAAEHGYNDSAPLLGSGNVQGAIDALKSQRQPEIFAANRAALSATSVANLPDLTTARVFTTGSSAMSFWRLEKTSTTTTDSINVLAATTGRWIRIQEPVWDFVTQLTWYVDYTSGNNEADGLTLGTAIQDDQEWFARTQGQLAPPAPSVTMTMNLIGTVWPHRFNYAVAQRGVGSFSRFFLVGQQTVSRAGTTTAGSTNPNQTTEFATITDSAVVSWAADVGKLIIAANGANAWVLADLGGGVARVTKWSTAGGGTATAPPIATAYNVVTLTQIGINTAPNSPLNMLFVQDVQLTTGFRSATTQLQWLRCKFTSAQVAGMSLSTLASCLINTGTWRLSDDPFTTAITSPTAVWASCGVLNTVVSYAHGYLELNDVCFQGSRLAMFDTDVTGVFTGGIGNSILTITGNYGLAFFAAPAGNPALFADFRATVYQNEALFGTGNSGTGVQLGHNSAFFVKSTLPAIASTGNQLVLPADPIPHLVQGAAVPATSACTTFAAVNAAPFSGEVWTTSQWCTVKVG